MVVNLYRTNDDKRKIKKSLYAIKTGIDCVLKQNTSVINPILIVDSSQINVNECNYAYIEDLRRYYYINNIEMSTGGRVILYLNVDVLMSFANDILSSTAIINKQEKKTNANTYINDGDFIATQKEFIRINEFPNGFNEAGTYILIACGG